MLVFRLSLSIISPKWFVSVKSFPIKDLLVSIALGWVSCSEGELIEDKPSITYTLFFASKNGSPRLPSVFRSIILVRVYDACLREQNETKKCKLHFLIASKQLLHRISLNRPNAKQSKYKSAVNVTKSTQAVPSGI